MRVISVLMFCGLAGTASVHAEQPKVKVGDVLQLTLKKMPKGEMDLWNRDYRVNDAGEVNLPLLGRFKVSGMTLDGAADAIEEALRNRDIYRKPDIDLQFPKRDLGAPKRNDKPG